MTTTACAGAGVTVEARTAKEAARIASVTGGEHLPATEPGKLSRRVRLSGDFEAHRAAVEGVTVLFGLFTDDGVPVPSGWTVTGASFEVQWPKEPPLVRSHFGARRYAFNWGLGQVKADMDAKKADPEHESVPWTLLALRKRWNQVKDEVAPWWAENSKPESTCALRRAPSPVGEGPTGAKAKQPRSKWPASGETPALKRHVQVSKGGSDRSGRSMKRRLPHRKALDGSGEPRWIW